MKDSKVRVNVSTAGNKRAVDSKDVRKEGSAEPYQVPSEGSAAPVLKWKFPEGLETKGGLTEEQSRRSIPDTEDMQEGPRGHRGPRSRPDAFGESGHGPRAAHTQPPERPAGAPAHGAGPAPGGPAAMPQGPHSAAEPQRFAQAAPGRVPRGGRTFRVRPARWGRRGFAARRPAAGKRRVRVHPAVWAVAGLLALALALPLLVVAPGNNAPEPLPPGPAPAFRRAAGGGRAHGIRLCNQDGYRGGAAAGTIPRRRPGRRDAGGVPAGGAQGPGHRGTNLYRAAAGVRRPQRRAGRQGPGDRHGQSPGLYRPRRANEGMASAGEGSRAGETAAGR